MARKPRFNIVGIPQHVIQRGNNREPCFYTEQDYYRYLYHLKEAATRNNCAVHAYILMTNHVHLLVTPFEEHGVSHMMQDIGRKYVRYINHVYKRSGTLWEGRFKSSLIDSDQYLLTCMRYIEMNPVRALMVKHPCEYKWSSYACNATGKASDVVEAHLSYQQLASTAEERQHAYREIFTNYSDQKEIHDIRNALNHELVLGRDDFKEKIKKITDRQVDSGVRGRPRVEDEVGIYLTSLVY